MTCKHDLIQTFRLETGEPVMWGCVECRAKFVPMRQLMDEVAAEREARLMAENEALRADAERYQWLRDNRTNYGLTQEDGYGGRELKGWEELDAAIDAARSKT